MRRSDLTFAVQDHTVATKPGRDENTNPSGTAFIKAMREGCRKNGIRLFDVDDREQGICHVVAPEVGIVLPGATHAVPDSHASYGRRPRRAGLRLRHDRTCAYPRHASDGDETAEEHAGASRR